MNRDLMKSDKFIILISILAGVLVLIVAFVIMGIKRQQPVADIQETQPEFTQSTSEDPEPELTQEETPEMVEPELPSTRVLMAQCAKYKYSSEILLPTLLSTYGDGTVNLDAYIAGSNNERLTFSDDFYDVTIYRMYGNSYSVIVETDETHAYYLTESSRPEIAYNEVETLVKVTNLPREVIIYCLGNLASLYPNCHYAFERDKRLWNVYSDLGLPLGTLTLHDDCAVFQRDEGTPIILQYYDFREVDTDKLPLAEFTESADFSAKLEEIYAGQKLHESNELDADELVKAYEEAGFPLSGPTSDSDPYIMIRSVILSDPPEFTHWYVDSGDGSLVLIDANKTKKATPFRITYAYYEKGVVYLMN